MWDFFRRFLPSVEREYLEYAKGYALEQRMPLWVRPVRKVSLNATFWAMRSHFEGTFESYNFDDEPPEILPNTLVGTTPLIESLRPKSPTQLREQAERRQRTEFAAAQERQRREIEEEQRAAAEMGIELAPRMVQPVMPPPQLPQNFREQSPFMAPR